MNYVIRTVPERMWFVCKYMIPELYKQGIVDLHIYEDTNHEGCLNSFLHAINIALGEEDGVWYLQDDIIFTHNFKVITEELYSKHDIICGFCSCYDEQTKGGIVAKEAMWYSFPCIYISNEYIQKFPMWLKENNLKYKAWIDTGKHDDTLFRTFIMEQDDVKVYNVIPNLVDHVDTYVGGSIVNSMRNNKEVVSLYFNEDRRRQEIEKICRLLPNE